MLEKTVGDSSVTKELAKQLFWALENDLKAYCKDKNIELVFSFSEETCTIDIEVSNTLEKKLDVFDFEICFITYQDILWTILHYEAELKVAYQKIDRILNS